MDSLAVTLLVIMLPGITAAVIADKLVSHKRWTSFKFTLYAFVLGVGSYALLQIIAWLSDVIIFLIRCLIMDESFSGWTMLNTWQAIESDSPAINSWELILATTFSVLVAFASTWVINHKVFNKIASRIGISNKYGDENLYSYFLNARGIGWVYVRDQERGLTYQGLIKAFSETESMQELVMEEVSVYNYEDSAFLYEIPTIYLTKNMGEFVIEAVPFDLLEDSNNE